MKKAKSMIESPQSKVPPIKPTRARGAKRAEQATPLNAPWNEPEVDDDPVSADIDEFRHRLAMRISRLVANERGAWRRCREPACKRHHVCASPNNSCRNAPPRKPDPDGRRMAGVLAKVQRAIRAELERRDAEGR